MSGDLAIADPTYGTSGHVLAPAVKLTGPRSDEDAMTNDEWDDLARRRVQQAKSDPRGYRVRVWAWALAGYAVLLGVLGLAIACVAGLGVAVVAEGRAIGLFAKLAVVTGALAVIIVRALAIKLPAPSGVELLPADAPELFDTIERLRAELDTPRVHHVLLDGDFNASIVQVPRLGPLGWERNYLTLGLACMQTLSREQFEFVLAHELGHISRSHGRFGAWIYRLRHSWSSVLHALDEQGFAGSGVARRFVAWYVPRLDACTVALVREHEHEADRAGAGAVGARHAALALVRLTALAPAVHDFWDGAYRRVLHDPAPPRAVFPELAEAVGAAPLADGDAAVVRALAMSTDTTATHPALSERLAALGYPAGALDVAGALAPPALAAADALLGRDGHARLGERLSSRWYNGLQDSWVTRHAEATHDRDQLERLDDAAAAGAVDIASARERAQIVADLRDGDAALAAWRDVLALDAGDAQANLAVGAWLLERGDDDGLGHLDRAVEASPLMAVRAAEIGYDYLAEHGRHEEAAHYRARLDSELDVLDAAADERRALRKSDVFIAHDLAPEAVAALSASLGRIDRVAHAYVARKRVEHLADDVPLYVVAIVRASCWWRPESKNADAQLAVRVAGEAALPGEFFAVPLAKNKWLRKRLDRIDGALVYGR
jgi:Zn-dependent protease with chaperone function